MPPAPRVPDVLRAAPFRGSDAVRSGVLTRRQLRGSTWRRLFPDVYVHREVPVAHELRARAAVVLLPQAVITGRSAAVAWGVHLAGAEDPVEVTVPPGSHQVRVGGLVVRRAALHPDQVCRRRGLRVSTPEATAVRLASLLSRDDAVCAVDQLVAARVVRLAAIRALAAACRGAGSARARDVAVLADGLAESPQESRVRLLVRRSHLPPPVAQYRIHDRRGFVARVDFAWPEHRVALEYDGLWHGGRDQFLRDRDRLNRIREAGWQVVFATTVDLSDPVRLISRIAAALAASAR